MQPKYFFYMRRFYSDSSHKDQKGQKSLKKKNFV